MGGVGGVEGFVSGEEGGVEFAADGHPFRGFEVVVLEEEEEGRGAEERGVLAVELGFAVFGRLVGGRLGWWKAGDWRDRAGCLVNWRGGRDC